MLTICKVTSTTAGYEVFNNFCLIRDAKKYTAGAVYVCKILNRFSDSNGNDHFAVTPISDKPISAINYDLATKIATGARDGVMFLLGDTCPDDLLQVLQEAKTNLNYTLLDADVCAQEIYDEAVQDYFCSLVQ